MRIAARLGTSLVALTIALPAIPATITPAGAQGLIDGLFRAPARRKRALRDKRIRQNRASRKRAQKVRRERRNKRAVAQKKRVRKQAAPARVAKKKRTRRAQTRQVASVPVQKVSKPKFLNYQAEAYERVNVAPAAVAVAAALAAERALLMAQPSLRQIPSNERAGGPVDVLERALGAKAMMAPLEPAADPVGAINAAADGDVADLLVPPGTEAPARAAPSIDPYAAINGFAELAAAPAVLEQPPTFETVRDPRIDQLAAREAAWRVLAEQSHRGNAGVSEAISQHYQKTRDFIWTDGERINGSAREAIRVMRDAGSWGLEARDYRVPPMPRAGAPLSEIMAFELGLTVAVAQYVRDAATGRINADGLSGYHDLPRLNPKIGERLADLANGADPEAVLVAAHPDNRPFRLLKAELEKLTKADAKPLPTLPERATIRAGRPSEHSADLMLVLQSKASPAVLDEWGEKLASYDGGDTIPAELDGFLRAMQKENGLSADGIIGPRSLRAFKGESNATKIERITLAMERMRWLPHELGEEHVFINQPAFWVQHMKGDDVNISMRVVVGKVANQTNFFYDKISHVEFNPDWSVPRSIILNEYLPRLRRDPGYLDRLGYVVRDGRGRRVSSSRVSWGKYSNPPFSVTQPSSSRGALGELKIDFPNRHAIYMHDTPAKSLFSRSQRAYSHGCVRLHDPRGMAAAVLGTSLDDVKRRIRTGGHHNAKVKRDIPVYIAYFTAFVKDNGEIGYYGDVYGRDKALKKALEKTRTERSI